MKLLHNVPLLIEVKSESKKAAHIQKLTISKIPQFLSNCHETWSKSLPHEVLILTKFHKDWAKIVELLVMANFVMCAVFIDSDFS